MIIPQQDPEEIEATELVEDRSSHIMPWDLICIMVRDYGCANCWGHLIYEPASNREWLLVCPNCGPDANFVTKRWIERRRQQDAEEIFEVRAAMNDMGIVSKAPKLISAILSEMGY